MPLSMININCEVATNFPRYRCDVAPYAPADCHGDNVAALECWNTVINHRVLSGFSQYTGPARRYGSNAAGYDSPHLVNSLFLVGAKGWPKLARNFFASMTTVRFRL